MTQLNIQKISCHLKTIDGFTLIELILVIVLLGIISAVALPKFVNLATSARIALLNATVASMNEALLLLQSKFHLTKTFYSDSLLTIPSGTPYGKMSYPPAIYGSMGASLGYTQEGIIDVTALGQPTNWGIYAIMDIAYHDLQSIPDPENNRWLRNNGLAVYLPYVTGRGVGGQPTQDVYFFPAAVVNWTTFEFPACYAVYHAPVGPYAAAVIETLTTGC